MQKRTLDLRSGQEVLAEIERLQTGGYQKAGNWSLAQICQHLDKVMDDELHGRPFKLPWIIRSTLGRMLVRRVLRTRKLPKFPAPKQYVFREPSTESENTEAADQLKQTIRNVMSLTGTVTDFPFATGISADEWRDLQWIHASHHLSFLVPSE